MNIDRLGLSKVEEDFTLQDSVDDGDEAAAAESEQPAGDTGDAEQSGQEDGAGSGDQGADQGAPPADAPGANGSES